MGIAPVGASGFGVLVGHVDGIVMTKSTNRSRKAREIANSETGTSYQAALNRLSVEEAPPLASESPLGFRVETQGFPDVNPWDRIIIGGNSPSRGVAWEPNWATSSLVVSGGVGSGKSLVADAVVLHCIQHPEWRVFLADPTGGLGERWAGARNVIHSLETPVKLMELMAQIKLEVDARHRKMVEESVSSYRELSKPTSAMMLVIDGYDRFVWESHQDEAAFVESLVTVVGDASTRAAGVHVVLSVDEDSMERFSDMSDRVEEKLGLSILWGEVQLAEASLGRPHSSMFVSTMGVQYFTPVATIADSQEVRDVRGKIIEMSNALATRVIEPADLLAEPV